MKGIIGRFLGTCINYNGPGDFVYVIWIVLVILVKVLSLLTRCVEVSKHFFGIRLNVIQEATTTRYITHYV